MKKLFVALMLGCLVWFHTGYAEENASSVEQPAAASQPLEKSPPHKEGHGISVFWMVFIGALLFVLSGATALNSLGGKPPPRSGDGDASGSRKPKTDKDPRDRFRL